MSQGKAKQTTQRQLLLQVQDFNKVHSKLIQESKPTTNAKLKEGLSSLGHKVNNNQFLNIKKHAREQSNFVMDISATQYSGMVEEIYLNLCHIEDEAFKLAESEWSIEVTRSGGDKKNQYTEITPNQYKPKHDFYKLALDVQKQKQDLLKGDVINVSVAMLQNKFRNMREEATLREKEIERLKEQLAKP